LFGKCFFEVCEQCWAFANGEVPACAIFVGCPTVGCDGTYFGFGACELVPSVGFGVQGLKVANICVGVACIVGDGGFACVSAFGDEDGTSGESFGFDGFDVIHIDAKVRMPCVIPRGIAWTLSSCDILLCFVVGDVACVELAPACRACVCMEGKAIGLDAGFLDFANDLAETFDTSWGIGGVGRDEDEILLVSWEGVYCAMDGDVGFGVGGTGTIGIAFVLGEIGFVAYDPDMDIAA
jgi:hypothetical protein